MIRTIIFIMVSMLYSSELKLNSDQKNLLNKAKIIAKKYHTVTGLTFESTIQGILLTESSVGLFNIGDTLYQDQLFDASLGPTQIRLATTLIMLGKYPDKVKYSNLYHKHHLIYKEYLPILHKYIEYFRLSKRYFMLYTKYVKQHKPNLALKYHKLSIKYHKMYLKTKRYFRKRYLKDYIKDKRLISIMMSDYDFDITISVLYLVDRYNYAYKHHLNNPYFRAVSAYNGGWNNKKYYERVKRNMKLLKKYF